MAVAVQEQPQTAVPLTFHAIHRIRQALLIITASTAEPSTSFGGMKIRHEVNFINSILSEAIAGKRRP